MAKPPPNKINWTNEMEQFIKDNYKVMNDKEIGKAFSISKDTIKKKRCSMGINRRKEREVPNNIINYGIEIVKGGASYSAAIKKCQEKFGSSTTVSTLTKYCERAKVISPQGNKNFMIVGQTQDKYEKLEMYNRKINTLKTEIKIGDRIDVMGSGSKTILEKYPNFVICLNGRFKEAIPYTDIKEVLESKR